MRGSNPAGITIWGRSSAGRAPALQAGGRGSESLRFHQMASSSNWQGRQSLKLVRMSSNLTEVTKNHRSCAAGHQLPMEPAARGRYACVVELEYTSGLSQAAARLEGSSPSAGTMRKWRKRQTRQAQALVPTGMRVQISPCAPQICLMKSAGADTGPENRGWLRGHGDQHLRQATYAQMVER